MSATPSMCVCVFAEEPLPSAYSRSRREQHANKIGSKQEESLFPSQTLFLSLSLSPSFHLWQSIGHCRGIKGWQMSYSSSARSPVCLYWPATNIGRNEIWQVAYYSPKYRNESLWTLSKGQSDPFPVDLSFGE